jgi:putative endonuclease
MPQATRSDDHRTYRCYLRGPDGIRELSPCGPGALRKLPGADEEVNAAAGVERGVSAHGSAQQARPPFTMEPTPPYPPHDLGRWGESYAADGLERAGWNLVARNYRFGRKEVDLIALRGRILAFIEVKTRSGSTFGPPESSITSKKRREIETVARDFLARRVFAPVDVRFDVVAIVVGPGRRVLRCDHLEDAWRP